MLVVSGGAVADGIFEPKLSALPAVSGVNHKLSGAVGELNGAAVGIGRFSSSVPLGHAYGFQLDGMAAAAGGGVTAGGVAGHLFWRAPDAGLLGVYGSFAQVNALSTTNIGRLTAEAELYNGQWTFGGHAGVDFGTNGTNLAAILSASFYPTDNIRLRASAGRWNGRLLGHLSVEAVPNLGNRSNLTFFVDAIVDDASQHAVFGGLRWYIGPDKSLIRRHREDDPDGVQTYDLLTKGTAPVSSGGGGGGGGGTGGTGGTT